MNRPSPASRLAAAESSVAALVANAGVADGNAGAADIAESYVAGVGDLVGGSSIAGVYVTGNVTALIGGAFVVLFLLGGLAWYVLTR